MLNFKALAPVCGLRRGIFRTGTCQEALPNAEVPTLNKRVNSQVFILNYRPWTRTLQELAQEGVRKI